MSDAAEVKAEEGEVKAEAKSEGVIPEDEHLRDATREILKAADLESVTKKTVRRSLESTLGLWHAQRAPLLCLTCLQRAAAPAWRCEWPCCITKGEFKLHQFRTQSRAAHWFVGLP